MKKFILLISLILLIGFTSAATFPPQDFDGKGIRNIYNFSNINATEFYGDGSGLTNLNDSGLNVNSSDYWDDMNTINATQMENSGGTLNILESWLNSLFYIKSEVDTNIATANTSVVNWVDLFFPRFTELVAQVGNFSAWDKNYGDLIGTPTLLSNFSDDLGNRGYDSVSNFTNDLGYYNTTDFLIADYYLVSNPYAYYNSTTIPVDEEVLWNANYSTFLTHIDWSEATNGTLYLSSNPDGYIDWSVAANGTLVELGDILAFDYYNITNAPVYENDTFAANYSTYLTLFNWNKTYADTLYYDIGNSFGFYNSTDFSISDYYLKSNPFGYYNSTTPQTETDPMWTSNQSSYSTTAEIIAFGYYNSTDFVITDYFTKSDVLGFNYYNATDFSIADYFTSAQVLAFDYYNSTDFSISDYVTSATLSGYNYYNATDFVISDYYTKTQINDFGFYNSTDFVITDYSTTTEANLLYAGIEWDYNQTTASNKYSDAVNVSQGTWVDTFFVKFTELVSQVGNFSAWDKDYADLIGKPHLLSNFTDDLGNRGYDSLSNFTDDLGDRGYNSVSNFTNDFGYYNLTTAPTYLNDTFRGNYSDFLDVQDLVTNNTFYLESNPDSFIDWATASNGTLANNATLIDYIDSQDTSYNNSIANYVNTENVRYNNSISSWVDLFFPRFTELVAQVGNWTADKGDYYLNSNPNSYYNSTNPQPISDVWVNVSGDTMTGNLSVPSVNVSEHYYVNDFLLNSTHIIDHDGHSIKDTFNHIINRGKLEEITVALTGGLGINWTAGEVYCDGEACSTDAGSGNLVAGQLNYLKWTGTSTLEIAQTTSSGNDILIATFSTYNTDTVNAFRETNLLEDTLSSTRRALRIAFPNRIISGMDITEDADATNPLDVHMDAGQFIKDGIEVKNPSAIDSRTINLVRHFHTASAWDSDTNAEIDTTKYDDGDNLVNIPANKYVKSYFILMQDKIGWIYPTTYYNNLAEAEASSLSGRPPGLSLTPTLTAIVYQQGDIDFDDTIWQDIRPGISEESFNIVTDHGALAGLGDNDHPQYSLITNLVDYLGNWSLDKVNYFTKTNILDFGYYNSTDFSISDYYTKTNIDDFGFIDWSDAVNGTLALTTDLSAYATDVKVDSLGNWSADSSDYSTTVEADLLYYDLGNSFNFYNLTDFDYTDYLLMSNTTLNGNYSASVDFCIASGDCLSGLAAASGISWTEAINGTLYLSSNPFSFYNSTDFSISDYVSTSDLLSFSYYNSTNPQTETDPVWISDKTDYSTKAVADTLYYGITNPYSFYNSTDFSIGDYYLKSNPHSFYNSTTIPQYLLEEVDPLWTGNKSSYSPTSDIISWGYYNSTNPSPVINTSYAITGICPDGRPVTATKNTGGGVTCALFTDFNNKLTLNYQNITGETWIDWSEAVNGTLALATDIPTDNSELLNGFNYWNNTFATFNKTYADTLYATIGSVGNPFDQDLNTTDSVTFQNLTVQGNNISIGSSEVDSSIWFYEDGSLSERLYWDDGNDNFAITDTFIGKNGIGVDSGNLYVVNGNLWSGGDIFTNGAGDDFWLGTSTQGDALFRGYANGSLVVKDLVVTDGISVDETDPVFVAWDNFTGIPTATPSDGDTTHLSTADQIRDYVIGKGYTTNTGTVTSIATTAPISGGTITTTGTISLDTATPSNGDMTHASTADQIYDWVIGLNYVANAITSLLSDTNPQLGGNLDANGHDIQIDTNNKLCLDGATCNHYVYYNGTATIIS